MDNKLLIALIDAILENKIKDIDLPIGKRGPRGLRGFKGDSGNSFNFEIEKEKIREIIDNSEYLKLKFEDLKDEDKEELRGPRGAKGEKGRDFHFEEHKEEIDNLLPTKEDLKLKFEDLSEEEKEELKGQRGPRGQRGKSGKDFEFEAEKERLTDILFNIFTGEKESLKLKFTDLEDEEKEELKLKFKDLTEDDLNTIKLKYSDLTEDEKEELKGERGPRGLRGQKGKQGIKGDTGERGPRGVQGQPGLQGLKGLDGIDGLDGKDAPVITEVEIKSNEEEVWFKFYLSDGSEIETNKVELPNLEKVVQNFYSTSGGGGSGVDVEESGTPLGSATTIDFDTGLSVSLTDGVATVSVGVARAASPGYTWGRMGTVGEGYWMHITGSVPSNKAGLPFGLTNGEAIEISIANEDVNTFTVGLYEHDGNEINLTQLGTVTMTNQRVGTFPISFSITQGKQLATKIESGTAKNVGIFLTIKGDAPDA